MPQLDILLWFNNLGFLFVIACITFFLISQYLLPNMVVHFHFDRRLSSLLEAKILEDSVLLGLLFYYYTKSTKSIQLFVREDFLRFSKFLVLESGLHSIAYDRLLKATSNIFMYNYDSKDELLTLNDRNFLTLSKTFVNICISDIFLDLRLDDMQFIIPNTVSLIESPKETFKLIIPEVAKDMIPFVVVEDEGISSFLSFFFGVYVPAFSESTSPEHRERLLEILSELEYYAEAFDDFGYKI